MSYTGILLAPKAMTLDDLERQNKGFMDLLAILGYETYFKSEFRRNH